MLDNTGRENGHSIEFQSKGESPDLLDDAPQSGQWDNVDFELGRLLPQQLCIRANEQREESRELHENQHHQQQQR